MVLIGPFIFRYTGVYDWAHIYKEAREFWLHRVAEEHDFKETLYKHKGKKIDIKWRSIQKYDAYYAIRYTIDWRIIMPRTVFVTVDGKRKRMMQGAIRCFTWYDMTEEYEEHSPAGESKVFQGKWLKALYRKITWRERWDLVDDIGMFTTNDYNELLKKLTEMHAGGYASIWEQG